jgi:hypothetical protein
MTKNDLLDVETPLGVSIEVFDLKYQLCCPDSRGVVAYVSSNGDGGSLGLLGEANDSSDGGVSL